MRWNLVSHRLNFLSTIRFGWKSGIVYLHLTFLDRVLLTLSWINSTNISCRSINWQISSFYNDLSHALDCCDSYCLEHSFSFTINTQDASMGSTCLPSSSSETSLDASTEKHRTLSSSSSSSSKTTEYHSSSRSITSKYLRTRYVFS